MHTPHIPTFDNLEPEYRILGAMLLLSLRDALQTKNCRQRQEALDFLWSCAPTVAERYGLPKPAGVAIG